MYMYMYMYIVYITRLLAPQWWPADVDQPHPTSKESCGFPSQGATTFDV